MKIAQYYSHDRIRLGWIRDNYIIPMDFDGDMIDFINRQQTPSTDGSPLTPNSVSAERTTDAGQ